MNKLFDAIQVKKPRTNVFDLGHERKLSFNMGNLVPILLQECVPGDKFRVNTEMLMRLAPMTFPVMHRMNVFTHFFKVPYRLLYEDWESFITGGKNGTDHPTFPTIKIANSNKENFYKGSLADHLGLPVTDSTMIVTKDLDVNALPFRAYQLIYNEYYRDQNLSNPVPITKDSTVSPTEQGHLVVLRKRAWEKDYFTSALPWAQRGPEVLIPTESIVSYLPQSIIKQELGASPTDDVLTTGTGTLMGQSEGESLRIENIDEINENITINELRRAERLQQWLERNARAGSRYIEQIFAHFGVKSSDSRLQRPEYLGGGRSPITISEVLNTTGTTNAPQGSMAGHGISVGNSHRFTTYCEEHCFIIGIMSVLPRTAYQNGVERLWHKLDKFDYYWPEFANLGEQEILEKEIFWPYEGGSDPELTWGYQSRYAEYKFKHSTVHGDFKDTMADWHMGRIFADRPPLNESFIMSDPTLRIFAVEDETIDHLYCQLYHDIKAIRPMPIFGTPSL